MVIMLSDGMVITIVVGLMLIMVIIIIMLMGFGMIVGKDNG